MGKVDENKRKKKDALFNTAYELLLQKASILLPSLTS